MTWVNLKSQKLIPTPPFSTPPITKNLSLSTKNKVQKTNTIHISHESQPIKIKPYDESNPTLLRTVLHSTHNSQPAWEIEQDKERIEQGSHFTHTHTQHIHTKDLDLISFLYLIKLKSLTLITLAWVNSRVTHTPDLSCWMERGEEVKGNVPLRDGPLKSVFIYKVKSKKGVTVWWWWIHIADKCTTERTEDDWGNGVEQSGGGSAGRQLPPPPP
jgi:hypothetical protein